MTDPYDSPITGAAQRRHAPRHKMFEPVALTLRGAELRAHFLDLSSTGALVHCEVPPNAGSYVIIHALDLETSGRVKWAKGKRFGIQFSQPLTQAMMNVLIRQG